MNYIVPGTLPVYMNQAAGLPGTGVCCLQSSVCRQIGSESPNEQ